MTAALTLCWYLLDTCSDTRAGFHTHACTHACTRTRATGFGDKSAHLRKLPGSHPVALLCICHLWLALDLLQPVRHRRHLCICCPVCCRAVGRSSMVKQVMAGVLLVHPLQGMCFPLHCLVPACKLGLCCRQVLLHHSARTGAVSCMDCVIVQLETNAACTLDGLQTSAGKVLLILQLPA